MYLITKLAVVSVLFSGCAEKTSESLSTDSGGAHGDSGPTSAGAKNEPAAALDFQPIRNLAPSSCEVRGAAGQYRCMGLLGRGAAGEVHLVEKVGTKETYAMKKATEGERSRREATVYRAVSGKKGFPRLIDSFEKEGFMYLVMTRIGATVESIRTKSGGKLVQLSAATVGSIGLQLVERLETLHELGYAHLDMFPNNIGVDSEGSNLILFDFGESSRFDEGEKTRLFDIQSLSHTVLQLLRPGTPYGDYKHYMEAPGRPNLEQLCSGLPEPVLSLFKYSHESMGQHEKPDYARLRSIFKSLSPAYKGKLIW